MNVSRMVATGLLFAVCGYVAFGAESPCVNASSFGWNATDATACLQAAIDSGAKKVVIDRQAGDWIVEPIFLRVSGQEVVVADGVIVRGGSFASRPKDATSSFRQRYLPWQKVFDVGFRVVVEE